MDTASLADYMTLNDQIAALIRAQVPIGFDLGTSGDQAAETLEKLNAAVARRVSHGEEIGSAIGEEHSAPATYRGVMLAGWRSGHLQEAIESSSRLAATVDESCYQSRTAFLYPLLVCLLAVAGITGLCLFVAPAFAKVLQEFRIPESSTLRFLEQLYLVVPYLAALSIFSLVVIGFVALWRYRNSSGNRQLYGRWWGKLTGASRAAFDQRCASFCEQLTILLNAGVPLDEGALLAAETCGDQTLREGARGLALPLTHCDAASEERARRHFPPFLRWALTQNDGKISRVEALGLAASVYREAAERRAERVRIAVPIAATIILGGGATLLYGLALFLPISEMLQALAR